MRIVTSLGFISKLWENIIKFWKYQKKFVANIFGQTILCPFFRQPRLETILEQLQKGIILLLIKVQSSITTPNEQESSYYLGWIIVSRP